MTLPVSSTSALQLIARFAAPYRLRFRTACASSLVNKLLDLAPPLLLGWAVDAAADAAPPGWMAALGVTDPTSRLVLIGLVTVVIFAGESFFQWAYQYGFMTLAQLVQHDVRVAAYRHLQQLDLAWFESRRTGDLMSVLNSDVNQLERFLDTGLNDLLQISAVFVIAGIILFLADPSLALVATAPIPFVIAHSLWFQRRVAPRYAAVREKVGEMNARLENNLSGIVVVKSFTTEPFEEERLHAESAEYRDRSWEAIRLSARFTPLVRMWIALGFAGCLAFGGFRVLNGTLATGTFAMFGLMVQRLLWPLTRVGSVLNEYERARASADRIARLLDTEHQVRQPASPVPLARARGEIELDRVSFDYPLRSDVLRDISFRVEPGQTLGLAGPTGAGKTTLIKLLLRLYDVDSGSIRIDGIDIRELSLEDLRRNISLVSQDVYLFHGTVRENITYGRLDATDEAIEEAARAASAHEFIRSLPSGYSTLIGERGVKLSGGQRQRVSLARAILKDAPIVVLDEATSSVDTETERAIQQALFQITLDRTALIIAHRLSTIRQADRILVLTGGRITEEGRHDDLVRTSGVYSDLWAVQSGLAVTAQGRSRDDLAP